MEVLTVQNIDADKNAAVPLKKLFEETVKKDAKVTFGTVVIPPGERIPLEGTSAHHENEYSIVIRGSVITESGEDKFRISKGQTAFIPAGERHWTYNDGDEDCEVVWVLVG